MKAPKLSSRKNPRHTLTTAQWNKVRRLLPPNSKYSPKSRQHPSRLILNAILWVLRTGSPWRDLDSSFPPFQTVHNRFRKWVKLGIFAQIHWKLNQLENDKNTIDNSQWNLDSTVVRAHKSSSAKNQAIGKSRGGMSSKIHVVTDAQGLILNIALTPGQSHEAPIAMKVFNGVRLKTDQWRKQKPEKLACDKAYDSRQIRRCLQHQKVTPVIPTKKSKRNERRGRKRKFSKVDYRNRNVVERAIGRIKEYRRVATRYEKLDASFESMIYLACITAWH